MSLARLLLLMMFLGFIATEFIWHEGRALLEGIEYAGALASLAALAWFDWRNRSQWRIQRNHRRPF